MSILIRCEAVGYYAARVRAELAGVDPEIIDDLTDGLEADLTEAILDGMPGDQEASTYLTTLELDALDARFGSPDAYAAELAQAAGVSIVPTVTTAKRRPLRTALVQAKAGVRADAAAFAARHRWAAEGVAIARVLRPVWWLARGLGLGLVLASILGWSSGDLLPRTFGQWVLALGFTVASVKWGQSSFGQGRWTRRLGLLLGWVAAVAVVVGLNFSSGSAQDRAWNAGFQAGSNQDFGDEPAAESGTAFFSDGREINNLFVFGPDGLPINGAQIVDQDGQPVVLASPIGDMSWQEWRESGWVDAGEPVPLGALTPNGQLNVFPYSFVDPSDVEWLDGDVPSLVAGAQSGSAAWPANTLFPVTGDGLADAPSPAPSVEPSPPASETPAPVDPTAADPPSPTRQIRRPLSNLSLRRRENQPRRVRPCPTRNPRRHPAPKPRANSAPAARWQT